MSGETRYRVIEKIPSGTFSIFYFLFFIFYFLFFIFYFFIYTVLQNPLNRELFFIKSCWLPSRPNTPACIMTSRL